MENRCLPCVTEGKIKTHATEQQTIYVAKRHAVKKSKWKQGKPRRETESTHL